MKFNMIALSAVAALAAVAVNASAETTKPAAPVATAPVCVAEKLTSDSLVGDLLDNEAAKAILIKHVPDLKDNDQIEMARAMSLRSLQAYAADTFTDKVLASIDADLATIPVCAK